MAKPEQILTIEPQNELRFRGPFNIPVTSYMKLTNPTDKRVVFKIKTTAPKKYCVRPNSGILESKNVIEIAICLQPFIFDPAEKNKHKFMVQTLVAPEGDFNQEKLWKDVSPENLMDSKLKCVFEMPVTEGDTAPAGPTENTETDEKIKRVSETKASPKASSTGLGATQEENELLKAAREVKQLREEESNLRQENLQLKEELLRLKHSIGGVNVAREVNAKYTPVVQPAPIPIVYVAIGIAMAFFGIILGKFIL